MVASSSTTALEGRLLGVSDALEGHGKIISDAFQVQDAHDIKLTTNNPSLFEVCMCF